MQRREFITLLAGAAALWPLAARAQKAMPVIGYLNGASAAEFPHLLDAFRRGLAETGFTEGRNSRIEYRYANGHYDDLPVLAADLVNQKVSVIVTTAGTPTILAAKAATSTIPIVFVIGGDPVRFRIVASLSRPGGNITGITLFGIELATKRLELLLELVPAANMIGVLANPTNPISEPQLTDLEAAAGSLGRQLVVLRASSDTDFAAVTATLSQKHVDALVVAADPFFDDRRAQIVSLIAQQKLPTCYVRHEFVREGGLISYGADVPEAFRQAGIYAGRILKGEKPADLPVMQPTKFELAVNLKAAKALGLTVPSTLLARADEVIE
jgi:putative tryptophan/tyrosine transport system substrate-binding protein